MDRNQVHDNSFGADDNGLSDEVFPDDSAPGVMSKNLDDSAGNESTPLEQFNENYQPSNTCLSLAHSIPGTSLPKEGSQFAGQRIFNDNTIHGNLDSGNGNSPNNLPKGHPNNNSWPLQAPLINAPLSSDVTAQNGSSQLLGDDRFDVASNNWFRGHELTFNRQRNIPLPWHTSRSVGIPSWKVIPQNLQPQVLRGNNFPTNIDFGYSAALNNLLEGFHFPRNQPSNNFEPLTRSPMIGGTSLYAAHQNNYPQLLADTPHSNTDLCQLCHGGNRCRNIQESVTGVGTNSAICLPCLIAKESNRSRLNNSKINPINISHPRRDQFIPDSSTAEFAKKEDLPLQRLRELPVLLKELVENGGNLEGYFRNMDEYANFVADELGKKLHEKPETDPKREKEKRNRNINAKKSNKKRPARELFLRGSVSVLVNDSKTLVRETKRLKQESETKDKVIETKDKVIETKNNVIQALLKTIKELTSRPDPTGLPEEPPPDDSNGGNSGGDSSGRGPGPGGPGGPGGSSSRNTQASGFNGMTFGNSQPSRDGSASDDLSARTASRMSTEKLLTSLPDGNCVSNVRDNVQSSLEKVYQDFLSEGHSDDDECDDYGESSDEGADDSTDMNYGKGDHCSETNNNEREACSTRNDDGCTSYSEKKDNWRSDCSEEADSALLEDMKMNERETADRRSHSSQMSNGECDDCTVKKGNARVGCIEMNDIGQKESKNNTNKSHLNSTPSTKPLSALPPPPGLPKLRGAVEIPLLRLPSSLFCVRIPVRIVRLSID